MANSSKSGEKGDKGSGSGAGGSDWPTSASQPTSRGKGDTPRRGPGNAK